MLLRVPDHDVSFVIHTVFIAEDTHATKGKHSL